MSKSDDSVVVSRFDDGTEMTVADLRQADVVVVSTHGRVWSMCRRDCDTAQTGKVLFDLVEHLLVHQEGLADESAMSGE